MRASIIRHTAGLATLLLALWFGIPLAAQQQKPPNPQLPDPNSQSEQQPAASSSSTSKNTPSTENSQSPSQLSSEENGQGQISSENEQTFIGTIVKSKDQFLLRDKASNANYQLDRQDVAKQYDGKDVRVTGRLDSSRHTIRVSTIEPLSM